MARAGQHKAGLTATRMGVLTAGPGPTTPLVGLKPGLHVLGLGDRRDGAV